MRRPWLLVLALCLGLGVSLPPHAAGLGGTLLTIGIDCNRYNIEGSFTSTRANYTASGWCNVQVARVGIQPIGWTARGAYDQATGRAVEDIVVPPAPINRPSHPYGTFRTRMVCPADPWLTENPTCQNVQAQFDTTLDRQRELENEMTGLRPPWTSLLQVEGQRGALNAKRKAEVEA